MKIGKYKISDWEYDIDENIFLKKLSCEMTDCCGFCHGKIVIIMWGEPEEYVLVSTRGNFSFINKYLKHISFNITIAEAKQEIDKVLKSFEKLQVFQ